MKILKRVRGWVQFLINNTTWQNWACLDAAFVVRHCTYSEEFEKLWTIWEIVNNLKLFTIASLIWIKTAIVTVTISAWACCLSLKWTLSFGFKSRCEWVGRRGRSPDLRNISKLRYSWGENLIPALIICTSIGNFSLISLHLPRLSVLMYTVKESLLKPQNGRLSRSEI